MTYLFTPAAQASVPVRDRAESFPVRRIYCCAQNYAEHEKEMGSTPERAKPFGFLKPADAVLPVRAGEVGTMPFPPASQNLHHELELVVALGSGGYNLTPEQADACIIGWGVGLDMTCRDLQAEAKAKGRPWDSAKAFDHAAPISELVLRQPGQGVPSSGAIALDVNGTARQAGDLSDMIWTPAEIISWFSKIWEFKAGDLVFTGTPKGVAQVVSGDLLEGRVAGVGELRVRIG
ncbi:fumarylacetoacetate hydrolase family protein [Uliginosibacterium sp. sgz301328]|uniref:fumarylacetoacetate hydrolase family protein n=1 Tax=Uliginosibacterium sp. sgz301328 TaxID=3243764 RepID=UPI00359CE7EA